MTVETVEILVFPDTNAPIARVLATGQVGRDMGRFRLTFLRFGSAIRVRDTVGVEQT